ncbi:MAG: hypothetical protein J0M30_02815 [Chitinophagales bacterium]|nr:hypothetical protein [Chitinophagales bacterium]
MNIKGIHLICTVLLLSCSSKRIPKGKVAFIQIYPFFVVDTINQDGNSRIVGRDSYLIINSPNDTNELKKAIDSFNTTKMLNTKRIEHFTQFFYKESKVTAKKYIDSKHNNDTHHKDLIAEYGWVDFGEIKYYLFYKNGKLLTNRQGVELSEAEN